MTVFELIEILEKMPQTATVYAEGKKADKVIFESIGNVVRIFKAWGVDFFTADFITREDAGK